MRSEHGVTPVLWISPSNRQEEARRCPAVPITLAPSNGWTLTPYGTAGPSATIVRNVVPLRGALVDGTSASVFTLPPLLRPPGRGYVSADLVKGRKERLVVEPSGGVRVEPVSGFGDAQAFTSLEGVELAVCGSRGRSPRSARASRGGRSGSVLGRRSGALERGSADSRRRPRAAVGGTTRRHRPATPDRPPLFRARDDPRDHR